MDSLMLAGPVGEDQRTDGINNKEHISFIIIQIDFVRAPNRDMEPGRVGTKPFLGDDLGHYFQVYLIHIISTVSSQDHIALRLILHRKRYLHSSVSS